VNAGAARVPRVVRLVVIQIACIMNGNHAFEQDSLPGIRRQRLAALRAPVTPAQRGLGVGVGRDIIVSAIARQVCDEDDVEHRGELFYGATTVAQHGRAR